MFSPALYELEIVSLAPDAYVESAQADGQDVRATNLQLGFGPFPSGRRLKINTNTVTWNQSVVFSRSHDSEVTSRRRTKIRIAGVIVLAARIADKSPIALQMAKEAVKSASRMNLREGLERETDLFAMTFTSEDKAEGVRAFFEKRKPDFKGR